MKSLLAVSIVLGSTICGLAAEKPRRSFTDSKPSQISGGVGRTQDCFGGASKGGARPHTAQTIKTLGQRCPAAILNKQQEKAGRVWAGRRPSSQCHSGIRLSLRLPPSRISAILTPLPHGPCYPVLNSFKESSYDQNTALFFGSIVFCAFRSIFTDR